LLKKGILEYSVYPANTISQTHSYQKAQYWRDPHADADSSHFIDDLNQEHYFNASYKANLLALKNLVLIRFQDDTMVLPPESQWFGFFKKGQGTELESLQETKLYKEDLLGLKQMEEEGRLHFISIPGGHLQLGPHHLETLVKNFLSPTVDRRKVRLKETK